MPNRPDARYSGPMLRWKCPSPLDEGCRYVAFSWGMYNTECKGGPLPESLMAISDFVLLESTVHASPAQRNDHASWPSDGADSPFGRHVSTGAAFPRPGVLREGRPCPAFARVFLSGTRHRAGVLRTDFGPLRKEIAALCGTRALCSGVSRMRGHNVDRPAHRVAIPAGAWCLLQPGHRARRCTGLV